MQAVNDAHNMQNLMVPMQNEPINAHVGHTTTTEPNKDAPARSWEAHAERLL